MESNDFLSELIDCTKKDYAFFEKVQNSILNMMDCVGKIFEEGHIPYFLSFGSLLGAVRDKRFIPWDIDFDIAINYNDFEKMKILLSKKLPDKYYFITHENKTFPYYQTRICLKGIDHRIHIDVFYLFNVSEDPSKHVSFKRKSDKLFLDRAKTASDIAISLNNGKTNKLISLCRKLYHFICKGIYSRRIIDRKINKLLTSQKASKYIAPFCDNMVIYEKSWFNETIKLSVNKKLYCCPKNYESVLNKTYKSYKEYLPFGNRHSDYESLLRLAKDAFKVKTENKINFRNTCL